MAIQHGRECMMALGTGRSILAGGRMTSMCGQSHNFL